MGTTFSWLHFTDLHRGMPEQAALWPSFEEKLFKDIREECRRRGPWDAVFLTGDLTNTGAESEFHLVSEFFAKFFELLSDLQPVAPALFTVPGNHDLVRPKSDPNSPELKIMCDWEKHRDVHDTFWKEPACRYRALIDAAFSNYSAWSSRPLGRPVARMRGLLPGDFAATLEKDDVRLGILGLNSSFLQLDGRDYREKLVVDQNQFNAACGKDGPAWAKAHDACLLLTHHPTSWLTTQARLGLTGDVLHDRFAVHLSGHMHEPERRTEWRGTGAPWRFWQGRSLFGLEHYQLKGSESVAQERSFGYSSGQLRVDRERGQIRLWPRLAQKPRVESGGVWQFIPDHGMGELKDDHGTVGEDIVVPLTRLRDTTEIPKPGPAAILKQVAVSPQASKLLKMTLESAARGVMYHKGSGLRLRSFCHIADKRMRVLVPISFWSLQPDDDYRALIPYEGKKAEPFIVSQAYARRLILADDIGNAQRERYPPELRPKIRRDLRCVIAAPICSFEDYGEPPLGTISFDSSSHSVEELAFDGDDARALIKSVALFAYHLLRELGAIQHPPPTKRAWAY